MMTLFHLMMKKNLYIDFILIVLHNFFLKVMKLTLNNLIKKLKINI